MLNVDRSFHSVICTEQVCARHIQGHPAAPVSHLWDLQARVEMSLMTKVGLVTKGKVPSAKAVSSGASIVR